MANALYDSGRDAFLQGSVNWLTMPIRAALVDITAYTVNLNPSGTGNTFWASVATAARVGFSAASLGTKTTDGAGVADAADTVFSAVSGPTVGAIVIFRSSATANASDWQLIAYIDTATGLPVGPNGGDITVQWDAGANKIFKL